MESTAALWIAPVAGGRSATLPGYHRGRPPRNKGRRYPADPADRRGDHLRSCAQPATGRARRCGMRGVMVVILWRAGLRIQRERSRWPRADLEPRTRRRSSCAAARAASDARSGWTAGRGSRCDPWLRAPRAHCRSDGRCSACSRGPTRGRACVADRRDPCPAATTRGPIAAGVRRTVRSASAPPRPRRRDERNATLNYRSVLARELTATDARLYGQRGGSDVRGGRRLMTERQIVSSEERRCVERFGPHVFPSAAKDRLCAANICGRGVAI